MVAGNIVEFDPENNTFTLPKEKAQYLTREGEIYNFAASMQWIPVLAQVEDEIVECFAKVVAFRTLPIIGSTKLWPRKATKQ